MVYRIFMKFIVPAPTVTVVFLNEVDLFFVFVETETRNDVYVNNCASARTSEAIMAGMSLL